VWVQGRGPPPDARVVSRGAPRRSTTIRDLLRATAPRSVDAAGIHADLRHRAGDDLAAVRLAEARGLPERIDLRRRQRIII
jgi:hypothetical protein